jgi:two-component system, NarL family, nitrate/nitrite response regulator NarL
MTSAELRNSTTDRNPTTVVLADDECMFRVSLRHLLTAPPSVIRDVYGVDVGRGFQVVGEASSGEETIAVVEAVKPDLLLLDLSMPRKTGLEALCEMRSHLDRMYTIMLAGVIDRSNLLAAVQLGVRGFIVKDSTTEVMFQAIVSVLGGRHWLGHTLVGDLVELVRSLSRTPDAAGANQRPEKKPLTPREREVLGFVVAGWTNKEIAGKFTVSEETVKHHLTRIFDKVGASNRLELAVKATSSGLAAEL